MRRALAGVLRLVQPLLRLFHARQPLSQRVILVKFHQPVADSDGDVVGVQRGMHREQPAAALIALADQLRLPAGVIQLLAHLHFEQRALFLDHDDQIDVAGEIEDFRRHDRPWRADLEQPDAELIRLRLADAQISQRLAHIEIGFSGGDNANFRVGAAGENRPVQFVRLDIGDRRRAFVVMQPGFLAEHIGKLMPADVEAARRHRDILRQDDFDPVKRAIDRGGRFNVVLDAFHRDPQSGKAAERIAVQAKIDQFLNARRIEDRHHHIDEVEFRLVRHGGRFRRVVIAHQRQHAAML